MGKNKEMPRKGHSHGTQLSHGSEQGLNDISLYYKTALHIKQNEQTKPGKC